MLTLTDNAVKRFKEMLVEENGNDYGIRIFAATSGCCGPSLAIDIADGAERGDATLEKNGIKVFLEKEASKLLSEATIDFSDKRGFIINGMPQTSCCG
ncbi:MAG: iron-sulfur cluster assembly accessory protein [Nitrospinae bacterium]|nr:iron-sulfur cluster assembly accessory protein [Nitrospinota bacterium]